MIETAKFDSSIVVAERPNIFRFHDYRIYLREHLQFMKQDPQAPSLRDLAAQMKISVTYLSLILSGSRKITKKVQKAFIRLFEHSRAEAQYFILLCQMTDSANQSERAQAYERVRNLHSYRKENPSEAEAFHYLTRWYHVAIRELALLPGFSLDPVWIQERLCFPVARQDVIKAVEFLVSKGFLVVHEDQRVQATHKQIRCVDEVFRTAMIQYHRQALELASQSMDIMTRDERLILGRSLALPQSQFKQAQKILSEALEKISELSESSEAADSIYHMGVFAIPVAELPKGKLDEKT